MAETQNPDKLQLRDKLEVVLTVAANIAVLATASAVFVVGQRIGDQLTPRPDSVAAAKARIIDSVTSVIEATEAQAEARVVVGFMESLVGAK